MFEGILGNDFMPHGYCFLWQPEILWLHVVSDLTIALAYFSIPITLLTMVRKRSNIPYKWVLATFSAFIFLCGLTHILSIWTVWTPSYGLEGIIKAMTAGISIAAAILILPIVPRIMEAFDELERIDERGRDAENDADSPV